MEHRRAAADVADGLGLPEPELVRVNVASLWRTGDVALRVAAEGTGARLIRLARLVSVHDVPTTRPLSEAPYTRCGLEVTAWQWVDEVSRHLAVPWRRVGAAVRRLHRVPLTDISPVELSIENVRQVEWQRIRSRLEMLAGHVDAGLLTLLRSEAEHGLAALGEFSADSVGVLLHGDLNPGNVLVSASGPLLIDWELTRTGPPHWDHVPLLIHIRRFGADPRTYDEFAAGYQARYDDDPLTEAMCRLRELSITLGQLRRSVFGSDPLDAAEAERRVQYWTSPEDGEKLTWTAR